MSRMMGNSLRALALTAAVFAAPEAAHAETVPTQGEVDQTLHEDYNRLSSSALKFAEEHPFGPNHVGKVAVRTGAVQFSPGHTGVDTEIQIDAFDKRRRTLNEYLINVYTPDTQTGSSTTMPYSQLQITLHRARLTRRARVPRTPAGFSKAINKAAAAEKPTLTGVNFGLGVQPDGSWNIRTARTPNTTGSLSFVTAPSPQADVPETSATQNFDTVQAIAAQAARVLDAAEHYRALPQGTPNDLQAAGPR